MTDFIPRPGIYHDLENEVYHGSPGISNSGLTLFARSPAHYYAAYMDPDRPPAETKAGQLEGTLAHCAALEPAEFSRRYVVGPDVSRATKEWKACEASLSSHQTPIKPDQAWAALKQGASIRNLPSVASYFKAGNPEVSAYWVDEETGVLCRCRPDWVHDAGSDSVLLLDVKTYSDASPGEFSRQISRKRYYVQAAFYMDGYAAASGKKVNDFLFIAVETKYPFASNVMGLDEEALEQGRREYRRYLRLYAECLGKRTWPG